MDPTLCILCRGSKNLCGLGYCPLLVKPKPAVVSERFYGVSSSVFVGSRTYPKVNVGPVGATDPVYDDPKQWYGLDYRVILSYRASTVVSKKREHVKSNSKIVNDTRLLSMSDPTYIEIEFQKRPRNIVFDSHMSPLGPSAPLKSLKITSNPKVPKPIDKVASDEMKASDAILYMYKHGQDVYKITTVMSAGVIGRDKRMVPTRWSITATDDILAKHLLDEIKQYPSINSPIAFENEYIGNSFYITLLPGSWEFDNIEVWKPKSVWARSLTKPFVLEDYECYEGKKNYSPQLGGYYATRLAVLEYLQKIRRQARVIVLREIDEKYILPLGVWVVRETVRNAFNNPVPYDVNRFPFTPKILSQRRLYDFK